MQEKTNCIIGKDYPAPIVDHALSVKEVRAKISAARKAIGFKESANKVYHKLGSRKPIPKRETTSPFQDNQLSLMID